MVGEGALLNSCGSLPKKSMFIDVNNARDTLPNSSPTTSCHIVHAPECEWLQHYLAESHLVHQAQRPAGPIRGCARAAVGAVRGLQKLHGVDQLEHEAGGALSLEYRFITVFCSSI
jgi:hypothetical protein